MKKVDNQLYWSTPYPRYALNGSGESLSAYSWVRTNTGSGGNLDLLNITAGGYEGSFERKLKQSGNGLVTGKLDVTAQYARKIPGATAVVTEHQNVSRYYTGTLETAPPDITPPVGPQVPTAEARNHALKILLGKYLRNRRVLAGVIIAEFGSSIDSVVLGINSAVDLFKGSHARVSRFFKREERRLSYAERRRKRRGLNPKLPARMVRRSLDRCLRRLSKEWLNISFGLMPLISDLEGISEMTFKQREHIRASKLRGASKKSAVSGISTGTRSVHGAQVRGNAWTVRTVEYKVLSLLRLEPGSFHELQLGIRLRDLPTTVWELLPYSWLADYVVNASDMIEHYAQFSFVPSVTQETLVINDVCDQKFHFVPRSSTPYVRVVSQSFVSPQVISGRRTIERKQGTGIPAPSIELRLPTRAVQQANLAALAYVKASKASLGDALSRIIRHF